MSLLLSGASSELTACNSIRHCFDTRRQPDVWRVSLRLWCCYSVLLGGLVCFWCGWCMWDWWLETSTVLPRQEYCWSLMRSADKCCQKGHFCLSVMLLFSAVGGCQCFTNKYQRDGGLCFGIPRQTHNSETLSSPRRGLLSPSTILRTRWARY